MAKGDIVTDPALLAKLNAGNKPKFVTDPALLARLEGGETEFDAGTMVSNIPSSAKQFVKDVAQPFMHPIDTAKGIVNLAQAGINKGAHSLANAIPDSFLLNFAEGNPSGVYRKPEWGNEKQADAVGQFYKDRFGSVDAIKRTAMNDPVGLLSDASAVLTGGGLLASKAPGIIGKAGKAVQKASMAMEPINAVKSSVMYGAGKLTPKSMPSNMYQSAAKFSTVMPPHERKAITDTALKYGITPNYKGVGKLSTLIDDVGKRIDDIIEAADATGTKISKKVVFKNLKELRKAEGGFNIYAEKNLKKIDQIAGAFDEYLKKIGKDTVTPSELQAFKRNVYDQVNWKGTKKKLITDKIEKAIARAAKERLEEFDPRLGDLNKQQGEMLQLLDPLKKSAGRIENRNPLSMTTPMNIGVGSIIGDVPGAVAGLGASLTGAPSILSRSAIGLYNVKNAGAGLLMDNSLPMTLGNQATLQLGRAKREGLLNF